MTVEGDFNQLEQVLLNVLLNAQAALAKGNGTIVFRAEPATPRTSGLGERENGRKGEWEKGGYVVIRVKDSGCGMSHEIMEKIFEPFYTVKKSKGTGMGLAMAYGCIENHNGWIHVDSIEGEGSEFYIFLPRVA